MQSYGLDIRRIANIFYGQKTMIVAVFAVVFCLVGYLALSLPNIYRSSTLVLVTPQKLPSSYVNSTVTTSIEQRIRAISEDVLSRTKLEKVITEFNLYPTVNKMDSRVDKLRKSIGIDVRRNDAFELSFTGRDPVLAQQVTRRLGEAFITENLAIREQQAAGTTIFMSAEADRLRKELEEQEQVVNIYKAQHRFELPEQLEPNLRTLEQLRSELQGNTIRLSSLQERKGNLEKQLVESKVTIVEGQPGAPAFQTLDDKKLQLEDLLTKYSEKHPDVVRLRKQIQTLEADAKKQATQAKAPTPLELPIARNPVQQTIAKQIADLTLEINALRNSNDALKEKIASYSARVDNTPVRAIELSKITRAYDITLRKYQDLQGKSLESQLSENMEKKQKAEQFQVMDPANLPQQPVAPDRMRIMLVGLVLALAAGFGSAFVRENLNSAFTRAEDLRELTNLPLLATLPLIDTRGSILEHRRFQRMLVLASAMVFLVGVVSIHIYTASF
ncbi:MAG TPA: XrtA system polysaccharide chain length determinant [Candidatus Binatia bacterium]|jgi:polysaccharide chain length determinant protein (PEP-CTERM system associated)